MNDLIAISNKNNRKIVTANSTNHNNNNHNNHNIMKNVKNKSTNQFRLTNNLAKMLKVTNTLTKNIILRLKRKN